MIDELLATAHEAVELASCACRYGVVGAHGYTADGWPIGGHLTGQATSLIAEARHMLREIGVPWEETVAVMPEEG